MGLQDNGKKAMDFFGIRYPTDRDAFFTRRNDILYARILLSSGIVALLNAGKDLVNQGLAPIPIMTSAAALVVVVAFVLMKTGRQWQSKFLFLILLNAIIAFLCNVVPKERQGFVYFFALITIAYVIFDDSQRYFRLFFTVLPAFLLLLLVFVDFKLFGDVQLSRSTMSQQNSVMINLVATVLIVTLCIDFMVKTNRVSERMLLNMTEDIQRKNEDLEKINGELDRFVYRTSHDLRAPLLSIQGLVNVALHESQDEKNLAYFSMIGERSQKLDEFIQEIIEYSRNARTELVPEEIDLHALIEEVIANLKYMEGADIIRFDVEAGASPVFLDRNRVKIVLSNLISNAIKYHNFRSEHLWVKVNANQDGKQCKIEIADNGAGIREEYQDKIFDMFFRGTEKSSGSGLGLYIVKEVIKKMQGHITLNSEFGKGSNFVVTLPLNQRMVHEG